VARLCDPSKQARIVIEKKAVPGRAILFTKQELVEGCSPAAADEFDTILGVLIREKRLVCVEGGKAVYYLHTSALEPLISIDARRLAPPVQPYCRFTPIG
jgi:hypothetical protein